MRRMGLTIARAVDLGTLMPVIGRERLEPSRVCNHWLTIAALGFGRRRRQVDGGGIVGPAAVSSAFSRQRPAWSFSTFPPSESRLRRSPVDDREPSTRFASATTLRPPCAAIAFNSFCSASRASVNLA